METNIYKKIHHVMGKVSYIQKTAEIQAGKSSYKAVTHDTVTDRLHGELVEAGIVIESSMVSCKIEHYTVAGKYGDSIRYETQVCVRITFVDMDNPGSRFSVDSYAHAFDNQDKSVGKANSMAVKNAMLKVFQLGTGENEEERVEELKRVKNLNIDDLRKQLIDKLKLKHDYDPTWDEMVYSLSKQKLIEKLEK